MSVRADMLWATLCERLRLWTISRTECDISSCADVSLIDPNKIFDRDACDREWVISGAFLLNLAIPASAWGVNPGDRRALFHLVRRLSCMKVLEIGTHIGASTAYISSALAATARSQSNAPRFVTVDIVDVNSPLVQPWRQFGASRSPAELVDDLGAASFVEFVAEPSLTFLARCDERFDLIFLDGDHRADKVYLEISAAMKVLTKDGWLLLHDYYPDLLPLCPGDKPVAGPYLAVKRLMIECPDIAVLPLGALPWPTKAGGNYTSLALVGRRPAIPARVDASA